MPGEKQDFSRITEDFIYGSLALSPVSATAAGYHNHRGSELDEKLDDYSRGGIQEQRNFYRTMEGRLHAIQRESLSAEDAVDYRIVESQIRLAMLDSFRVQSWRHNPTMYVELIGNALFTPSVLEYAPKEKRFKQIIRRLDRVPILLDQARGNLQSAPSVWVRVAQEENDGNIALVDRTLRAAAPAELKGEYDKAAKLALDALRKFNVFLKDELSKRPGNWRLGKEFYDPMFKDSLDVGKTPVEVLGEAEGALKDIRAEMVALAAPQTVPDALNRIAQQHATPETYLDEARRDLEQATAFVKAKQLLPLPELGNLQVIPTPEFMRGVYGVGGFAPAPALEPKLGAFYWVTPIPADWPKERIESKLREYNTYGVQQLTIHEAMPGHYVQFEYANRVQPQARRMLRSLYGNVPYVEGWGVFAQQWMGDAGYLDNSKDLKLTFLKNMLRVSANAILDIKLHTQDMSEQDALDLMIDQTYQEKEEATAKLQRAQLSVCQLPAYFVGWRGWQKIPKQSIVKALGEGAVPLSALPQLLQAGK
jgi:uncharacterized protein (DUF885 family)